MTYSVLDLFCGGGGFSLGAKWNGLSTYGIDNNPNALKLYRHNVGDCRQLDLSDTKSSFSFIDSLGDIPIWVAGIPCQSFSLAGKRDLNDPRRGLVGSFFDLISYFYPPYFVIEEVLPALKALEPFLDLYKDSYNFQMLKIDASDWGVPQKRKRLFIIASDKKQETPLIVPIKRELVSFTEAIEREYTMTNYASRLNRVSNSCNQLPLDWDWGSVALSEEVRARLSLLNSGERDTKKRLRKPYPNLPAYTQLANKASLHATEPRHCTVREMARLQSFPDSYQFNLVTPTAARSVIGNSVCPLVSYEIFKQLLKQVIL